jgi:hypothetical protein
MSGPGFHGTRDFVHPVVEHHGLGGGVAPKREGEGDEFLGGHPERHAAVQDAVRGIGGLEIGGDRGLVGCADAEQCRAAEEQDRLRAAVRRPGHHSKTVGADVEGRTRERRRDEADVRRRSEGVAVCTCITVKGPTTWLGPQEATEPAMIAPDGRRRQQKPGARLQDAEQDHRVEREQRRAQVPAPDPVEWNGH